ncbi:uncharacterized protein DUF1217 [Litoreibacter meonggei]|uniref:Uncharacterized protein DUF1217 n=1 Tax=Litoreibacter meonggei TaxID=1049199 RepID=A0A497VG58_9RHOB|nr:DUF1217 domain-containing protein [Litoreibacter meonggei]RLJ41197.1 uncharacterized protein DUF1217 [Litoreibacter meonggei]
MTFIPIVPLSGLQGWTFLSTTMEAQKDSFDKSEPVKRDAEAFRERISNIRSAEDLVKDRSLLSVALTAFGLEADIDNLFLIRKVLEDGTVSPDALANRFSDKRYLSLSKAFGFGDFDVPRTQLSDFPDEILTAYSLRKFEAAVGDQDQDLRLALSFDREILEIAEKKISDTAKWFEVLGNAPLKSIIEKSLFLPSSFGNLQIDQQVDILKGMSSTKFDVENFDRFLDLEIRNKVRTNFLLASQVTQSGILDGASTALSLLEGNATLRF